MYVALRDCVSDERREGRMVADGSTGTILIETDKCQSHPYKGSYLRFIIFCR